ncbi:MAG: 2-amino-4-hydroxy-6-hydroxymethyldihydropteridine diphosphokinase [Gammaproteobacteria bacterium]|jgi:2-amino-4-hydroxy-6-hydroxymethyldihydropteridine diphosphokinase|uniref:2-amino-4-hydroxy-6-hydroxymethyldihydropteridine diphosphokinase n=1 Tax=SAR86 cluster bacterium SAR86B TaxID=1123867 RepID=J5KIE4_9GAMM|nr:MAG: 2-amino-4-hydroxy-6-hydroxymethyldihydropteridine diphosphokinase [SAR86 cluster bacterium SAR86B]|tara:strand:- start:891 stop:1346 length:456 start_codon:yes stop_codon:yes gene_type:complete
MKYYLSIGSNIEPVKNIIFSIKELKEILADINISNTYVTPSIGFEGPEFLNLIISGNTELSLEQLNALLKVIEDNAGRDRTVKKFDSRTLDIDIVLAVEEGAIIYKSDEIKKYSFVNVPLHDIYEEEASILMIEKDSLVISEDNQEILKCI